MSALWVVRLPSVPRLLTIRIYFSRFLCNFKLKNKNKKKIFFCRQHNPADWDDIAKSIHEALNSIDL